MPIPRAGTLQPKALLLQQGVQCNTSMASSTILIRISRRKGSMICMPMLQRSGARMNNEAASAEFGQGPPGTGPRLHRVCAESPRKDGSRRAGYGLSKNVNRKRDQREGSSSKRCLLHAGIPAEFTVQPHHIAQITRVRGTEGAVSKSFLHSICRLLGCTFWKRVVACSINPSAVSVSYH